MHSVNSHACLENTGTPHHSEHAKTTLSRRNLLRSAVAGTIGIAASGLVSQESVSASSKIRPVSIEVRDDVDLIEVNHVYDSDGNLVIDQVIFWNWNPKRSCFEVVDWRLLRGVRCEITDQQRREWRRAGAENVPPPVGKWRGGHALPRVEHNSNGSKRHVSFWYDEKSDVWRNVTAPISSESWTAFDKELVERKFLPQKDRKCLTKRPGEQQRARPDPSMEFDEEAGQPNVPHP